MGAGSVPALFFLGVDDMQNKTRYCYNSLPRTVKPGRFLVHNHVRPVAMLGLNGFRAWTQEGRKGLVRCRCDFGGCENAELHEHYRVLRAMVNRPVD
jgi:hypothetical protein